MEYVNQHGAFDDMPLARIVAAFETTYPSWRRDEAGLGAASFEADVANEVQR